MIRKKILSLDPDKTSKIVVERALRVYGILYIVFWRYAASAGIGLYLISYILSYLLALQLEAEVNPQLLEFANFFQFHFVTASTIGYGALTPHSKYGKIFLPPLILFIGGSGLIALSAFILKLFKRVIKFGIIGEIRIMKKKHIVVISESNRRADILLENLLAHEQLRYAKKQFVACVPEPSELMTDGRLSVIELERDSHDENTDNSSIAEAACVIVDLDKDSEALRLCLAINAKNPDIHMAVVLENMKFRGDIRKINPRAVCTSNGMPEVAITATAIPTRFEYQNDVNTPGGDVDSFEIAVGNDLPKNARVADITYYLSIHHKGASIVYLKQRGEKILSPEGVHVVRPGDVLGCDGKVFVKKEEVEWGKVRLLG